MIIQNFVDNNLVLLISKIKSYLDAKITHQDMREFVDKIFDDWDNLQCDKTIDEVKGESSFWYALWTIQHLADEEHWKDGITKPELIKCLGFIEKGHLPDGYIGRRP